MTTSPVPVTVLTGFLGAGKTTLLNALLRRPALHRTAVVINEFGEVGIDHLLVDAVAGDLLLLTTGCICCAARGDLLTALQRLLVRRQCGAIGFDRIVVETTGLAEPGPILDAILLDPALRPACRLDGVVTVFDAQAGASVLEAYREAWHQVALADVIVLSKTDLVPAAAGDRDAPLRALNPAATVVIGQDLDAVEAAVLAPNRAPPARPVAGRVAHHHAHHRSHTGVDAVYLEAGTVDPERLDAFIASLLRRAAPALLRVKGIVASAADPARPIVIHAVGSRLHPSERLAAWPSADHGTRIVVILDGGSVAGVLDLWNAYFGPPAIDRPDAAGLAGWRESGPGLF